MGYFAFRNLLTTCYPFIWLCLSNDISISGSMMYLLISTTVFVWASSNPSSPRSGSQTSTSSHRNQPQILRRQNHRMSTMEVKLYLFLVASWIFRGWPYEHQLEIVYPLQTLRWWLGLNPTTVANVVASSITAAPSMETKRSGTTPKQCSMDTSQDRLQYLARYVYVVMYLQSTYSR